jgi:hypothetical protein
LAGGGGGAGGAATTTGSGGRRDGENKGRSRVPDNDFSGIVHKGFPVVMSTAGLFNLAASDVTAAAAGRISVSITVSSTGPVAPNAKIWDAPYTIVPKTRSRMPQPRKRLRARGGNSDIALTRQIPRDTGAYDCPNISSPIAFGFSIKRFIVSCDQ